MAFRGTKPAIKAYEEFKATVKAVEAVVTEKGEVRYFKVTTTSGVVNLGANGISALQQRYDFDDLTDIVGQDLDFKYTPNSDTRYGDYQLAFVLGRKVEGIAPTASEEQGGLEF